MSWAIGFGQRDWAVEGADVSFRVAFRGVGGVVFPPPTQLAALAGDVVRGWAFPASWQKKNVRGVGQASPLLPNTFSAFPTLERVG